MIMILCCQHAFAGQPLTLEESKMIALKNNYKIINSQLEIDAARQMKKAVLTKYFPNVSASGAMFKTDGYMIRMKDFELLKSGTLGTMLTALQPNLMSMGFLENGTLGMVTAVQPIFAGGRIFNSNRLASLDVGVNELKSRLSKNEVLLKTEEQYWLVVSLDEKLKTVHKYEALLDSLQRQAENAYNAGIVLKNDVLKVKLKKNEVLLNKSKLENGKKLASMAFCQYIGIPYNSNLVLKDSLNLNDVPQMHHVDKDEAVKNRAEYDLLQASVKAEDLQTKIKLGEYLPQVAVGVGGVNMKFDGGDDRTIGMAFGTVSIPLSGWWEAYHTLSRRGIKEQIARNNFKDNSELLILQIEKAWQDFSEAYRQVLLSKEAKSQAEENLDVNQDSYENGLSNVSDLLEAQAALQQTNDQLTESMANYLIKKSFYLRVTGR